MKVLMVGPFPQDPTHPDGGVEAAVHNLAGALSQIPEVRLEVISTSMSPPFGDVETTLGRMTRLPYRSGLKGWLGDLHRRVFSEIKTRHFDVLHVQGIASIAARVPQSILTVHGISERDVWTSRRGTRRVVNSAAVYLMEGVPRRRVSNVIAISEYTLEQLHHRPSHSWRIPNAIDPVFFGSEPDAGARDRKTFLYAGRVSALKNVSGLIRAFSGAARDDKDLRLLIAGGGVDSEYGCHCQDLVHRLGAGSSVTFLGSQTSGQLRALLAEAATMVLFSWQENAPMVIAEALAVGAGVIGSATGAVGEMTRGLPGCSLVHPGDVKGLESAIALRADSVSPSEVTALRSSALKYNAQSVAQDTFHAYQDNIRFMPK